jgi:mono/diheme cytochrome c family protein
MRRTVLYVVLALVAMFALAQAVPYGHDHSDPPTVREPAWNSPHTRQLTMEACGDCHSNRTRWPWYTSVAPVSWLTENDVKEGRKTLNFSEWDRPQQGLGEIVDAIKSGSMPPWQYKLMHGKARLSAEEKRALIAGLEASLGP